MKRIISILFISVMFLGCKEEKSTSAITISTKNKKVIDFEINRNQITYRIAHNLIKENRQWPTRSNPVRDNLFDYFADFQDHEVLEMIQEIGSDDVVSLFLLHKKEFPDFGDKYSITDATKRYQLEDTTKVGLDPKWDLLYESLFSFYKKADVEQFIEQHKFYYQGAIDEIASIAKEFDVVGKMEEYTNQINDRYVISPEPLFITGGTRGIGPLVETNEVSIAYQLISPSNKIDLSNYKNETIKYFGYNDREYIRELCIHEFGHSFVNQSFYNENITNYLKRNEQNFTAEIKASLNNTGIGNFTVYLIEHIVRLLEIRIAEIYFGKKEAQSLRTSNKDFIYLAKMEEMVKDQYEKQNSKYDKFSEFIPELLKVVNK